jgi:hypothetical protein
MPRPATPIVAVVIAAVAGLLGLLVLKNVKDDSSGGSSNTPKTTVAPSTTAPDSSALPTTTVQMIRTGATVIVANASKIDGMAGALSNDLKTRGYTMGKPVTSTVVQDTTQILAKVGDAAAQAVARSLIVEMGLSGIPSPLTDTAPLKSGDLGAATVVIVLGKDKAGQPLPPIGGSDTTQTSSPATQTTSATPKTTTAKTTTTAKATPTTKA